MPVISYRDIQYQRDTSYMIMLKPVLDRLLSTDIDMESKVQAQEEAFYFELSNSVKVDNLTYVSELLKKIFSRLRINIKTDIFLCLSNTPSAACMPRYHLKNHGKTENVVILVSQHFFNDLNFEEQASVLGHEIGHFLFGHTSIPKDVILKNQLLFEGALKFKSDLLKWSICAEISADMIGLVANGLDGDSFISAMLKFTTGLNNPTYNMLGVLNLKKTILNQYLEITHAVQDQKLASHPMTPLRLKLAENLVRKDIFKRFGTECSTEELASSKHSLNNHIDHYVLRTYPDIIPEFRPSRQELLLKMAIAVSISDGMISQKEYEMITSFIGTNVELNRTFYNITENSIKDQGNQQLIVNLINECIAEGRKLEIKKPDVILMIRNLLIIAVSDGMLYQPELNTIAAFADPFGISREEIVFLKNQMRI
jgi:hypothetical protein